MKEEYICKHFSLALPVGNNQENVPMLLEHLADNLREINIDPSDILDITYQNELGDDGKSHPSFTVYYSQENS